MDLSLIIAAIFFVFYSISLWYIGYVQPRTLKDEQCQTKQYGSQIRYTYAIIICLLSLMVYLGANFFASRQLVNYQLPMPMYQTPQYSSAQPSPMTSSIMSPQMSQSGFQQSRYASPQLSYR